MSRHSHPERLEARHRVLLSGGEVVTHGLLDLLRDNSLLLASVNGIPVNALLARAEVSRRELLSHGCLHLLVLVALITEGGALRSNFRIKVKEEDEIRLWKANVGR